MLSGAVVAKKNNVGSFNNIVEFTVNFYGLEKMFFLSKKLGGVPNKNKTQNGNTRACPDENIHHSVDSDKQNKISRHRSQRLGRYS